MQPGQTVTYKDTKLKDYEGIVMETSSQYTVEVSWFKPNKVSGTEWKTSLIVLDKTAIEVMA